MSKTYILGIWGILLMIMDWELTKSTPRAWEASMVEEIEQWKGKNCTSLTNYSRASY